MIILAAGFARALLLLSRLEEMRAQGKPDASRIRWPRVQKVVQKAHKHLQSPQDEPNIRLSLHDEL